MIQLPPKSKFTREEIIKAALFVVRSGGAEKLTARALGETLGSSPRPVFTLFDSMQQVRGEVIKKANEIYKGYIAKDMAEGRYPPYKASGMAYIRFAREERQLFKLLFMRDRSDEKLRDDRDELAPILNIIEKNTGLDRDRAYMFHMEMWIFVHGIASMIATGFLDWDMKIVESVLTDMYVGMRYRYCGEDIHGSNKNG